MQFSALLTAAFLVGCTQFPDLDARNGPELRGADYPALLPVDRLLAGIDAPRITEATASALAARIDTLQARADRLRGRVIDSGTRARMARGLRG